MIDPEFLAILACPRCPSRPPLMENEGQLVCSECGVSYKIVNGVPRLLPEDAEEEQTVSESKWNEKKS